LIKIASVFFSKKLIISRKSERSKEEIKPKADKSKGQRVPIFLVYRLETAEIEVNKKRYSLSRDSVDSENNAVSAGKTICKQLRKMTGSNM